jgi:hypothetical protein
MYKYLLSHSLHFIKNTLLFSLTAQYWASQVTAFHHNVSLMYFPSFAMSSSNQRYWVLISIMGTKTSISQSKQVSKLYSYCELIIQLVKQLSLSMQSSMSHSNPKTEVIMVWMWFARNVVTQWPREAGSGQSLVWANSNCEMGKLRNQHPRNMYQMQRGRYSM